MTDSSSARFNPLRTTPNLLTISRICLAPFLVSATLERRFQLSFVLFVVAGLTGLSPAVRRRGAPGVQAQHLRQGEHRGPGERGWPGSTPRDRQRSLGGLVAEFRARRDCRPHHRLRPALRVGGHPACGTALWRRRDARSSGTLVQRFGSVCRGRIRIPCIRSPLLPVQAQRSLRLPCR